MIVDLTRKDSIMSKPPQDALCEVVNDDTTLKIVTYLYDLEVRPIDGGDTAVRANGELVSIESWALMSVNVMFLGLFVPPVLADISNVSLCQNAA
jgi:hypothetical protein